MKRILFVIFILNLGLYFQSMAQDLLVTPTRVLFDGNKLREELNLVNIGKEPATYSIFFVHKNMKEDGSFVSVANTDSTQMFADPYLRVFPRRITLAPGDPQIIMLQCKRQADMKAGEYRSHLYFRTESDSKPLEMSRKPKDTTALNVQLTPVFGISIPVIVRSGVVNVSATLSDLKLDIKRDTLQSLKLTINRSGNISLYGDIIIDFVPNHGKPYQIATTTGVAVYSNITKRILEVDLKKTPAIALKNGKLSVRYIRKDDLKHDVYTQKDLDVN